MAGRATRRTPQDDGAIGGGRPEREVLLPRKAGDLVDQRGPGVCDGAPQGVKPPPLARHGFDNPGFVESPRLFPRGELAAVGVEQSHLGGDRPLTAVPAILLRESHRAVSAKQQVRLGFQFRCRDSGEDHLAIGH